MQPLIHGIYSLETPAENRVQFYDAVHELRKHCKEVIERSSRAADGAPSTIEEGGGLVFKTTDEFWLEKVDLVFWNRFARKYPRVSMSLYYCSMVPGECCGMFQSLDGNVSDVRYPKGSPEALEFYEEMGRMNGLNSEEDGI